MPLIDRQRVLQYCKLQGATIEEQVELANVQESVEAYLLGGGCVETQATDPRFAMAVCRLTLHWYDHRSELSELNTNPTLIPLGVGALITQLKADALKASKSDTGEGSV